MANRVKVYQHKRRQQLVWTGMILLLFSLACSLTQDANNTVRIRTLGQLTPTTGSVAAAEVAIEEAVENQPATPTVTATQQAFEQKAAPTRTPLPTLTPTAQSVAVSTNQQSSAPASAPTVTPTPTLALPLLAVSTSPTVQPTARPTATPPSIATPPPLDPPAELPPGVPGWSFVGIRTTFDGGDTAVVGELVNNTGSPQTDVHVSGAFYNKLDQIIVDQIDELSYVAAETVPIGGVVPFELFIESIEPVYRIDLYAMSEAVSDTPRQDFQISNVSQWMDALERYCVGGNIQNNGQPLSDYLIVLAATYNSRGQVANFGEYAVTSPNLVVGDQSSTFEMCVDPLGQQVAFHEINAIGY